MSAVQPLAIRLWCGAGRRRVATGLGVAGLAAAAFGGVPLLTPAAAAGPTEVVAVEQTGPGADLGGSAPGRPVAKRDAALNLADWTLLGLSPDRRSATVAASRGACQSFAFARAYDTAGGLTVQVVRRDHPPQDGVDTCALSTSIVPVTVALPRVLRAGE